MSTAEIAKKYFALVQQHKYEECLGELFAKDATSVEAASPPGSDRTAKGIAAIAAKSKWWVENHTIHKAEVFGPYPHDDRFAVRFLYDITNKPTGKRMTMDDVKMLEERATKLTAIQPQQDARLMVQIHGFQSTLL